MIDKETWKIGTDCNKMEKLIKYNIYVQYYNKSIFLKKKKKKKNIISNKIKKLTVFFLLMASFKTHLNVIGKFRWIGKMTYNIIK